MQEVVSAEPLLEDEPIRAVSEWEGWRPGMGRETNFPTSFPTSEIARDAALSFFPVANAPSVVSIGHTEHKNIAFTPFFADYLRSLGCAL